MATSYYYVYIVQLLL